MQRLFSDKEENIDKKEHSKDIMILERCRNWLVRFYIVIVFYDINDKGDSSELVSDL